MRLLLNRNFFNICKNVFRLNHLDWSPNFKLHKKIWDRYRKLPIANCKVQATYIWIDGTGENLRSKTRTLDFSPSEPKDCPDWDFDGSSAGLATVESSDVHLCPVAVYNDPITQGSNKYVLCETYQPDGKPTKTNHRFKCMEAVNKVCEKEVMSAFEQEFFFMDFNNRPFGWPTMLGEPSPLVEYYCGVGAHKAWGREILECVYRCLLYCGILIGGTNGEVAPSQWELQIGAGIGIKVPDDLWMARYILARVAEDFGVGVSIHPKLLPNWSGSGMHVNFSTKEMRDNDGYKFIEEAAKKLEKTHEKHMKLYDVRGGEDNKMRLTGRNETSKYNEFRWGVADRGASIRINRRVHQDKKGYFEDRRPSSNADPYQVLYALIDTVCLDECKEKK